MNRRSFSAILAGGFVARLGGEQPRGFRWENTAGGKLRLFEDGEHVLDYNYGLQLKPGVAEDRRRGGYIYPLLTPAGVNPLDDFPADHPHHRGLFWAWMSITHEGKTYDLWTLKPGIEHRFHRFLERGAREDSASLAVENGWYTGNQLIVREAVKVRVSRAVGNLRNLDLELELDATRGVVVLAGSPENGKGYGGLSLRFAPRTETRIFTPEGLVAANENEIPHASAALEAVYGGKRAGIRITSDAANPGHPPGWCLRPYGFVGANFPGYRNFSLTPHDPLKLQYRVTVYDA